MLKARIVYHVICALISVLFWQQSGLPPFTDWTHPSSIGNLNGVYYVDAASPSSCVVNSVSYTTAFDCAMANAKLWISTSDSPQANATIYVGSNGQLTTALGAQMPTATNQHGTVNIIGRGVNSSIIQLTSSLSAGVCMVTQPSEATALNYATITITGLTLDANNDADCVMLINGVKNGLVAHVVGKNNRAGSGNIGYQVGTSNGSTSTVFETFFDDVKLEGTAGGYTPAIITTALSSGNPVATITDAGSYPTGTFSVQVHGVGNGAGPCSVYPTWTATGTTTLTGLTASGGTCVAPVYTSVTPAAKVDYNFLIGPGATDSTFKDLRAVESSAFAGIKITGHPNHFIHPHCYVGQYACIEDYGGNIFAALESDSVGGYAVVSEGNSIYTGINQIYNSFTRYAGSALVYVDTSVTANAGITVNGVNCNGNRQGVGGYHNLVLGTGLPYTTTSATGGAADAGFLVPTQVQMDNVLNCSSSPTVNTISSHIGNWPIINGYIQMGTVASFTCNAAAAGSLNYIQGNSSTKDIVQVCAHDASNTYAWRSIY